MQLRCSTRVVQLYQESIVRIVADNLELKLTILQIEHPSHQIQYGLDGRFEFDWDLTNSMFDNPTMHRILKLQSIRILMM